MTVWVVLDRWGSDPDVVWGVFSTREAAQAAVDTALWNADDYELARHTFTVREWTVQ